MNFSKSLREYVGLIFIAAVVLAIFPDICWLTFIDGDGLISGKKDQFWCERSTGIWTTNCNNFCFDRYAPVDHGTLVCIYIFVCFFIIIGGATFCLRWSIASNISKEHMKISHHHKTRKTKNNETEENPLFIMTYVTRIFTMISFLVARVVLLFALKELTLNMTNGHSSLYFQEKWWCNNQKDLAKFQTTTNELATDFQNGFHDNIFQRFYIRTTNMPYSPQLTFIPKKNQSNYIYTLPKCGNSVSKFPCYTSRAQERTLSLIFIYIAIVTSILLIIVALLHEIYLLIKRLGQQHIHKIKREKLLDFNEAESSLKNNVTPIDRNFNNQENDHDRMARTRQHNCATNYGYERNAMNESNNERSDLFNAELRNQAKIATRNNLNIRNQPTLPYPEPVDSLRHEIHHNYRRKNNSNSNEYSERTRNFKNYPVNTNRTNSNSTNVTDSGIMNDSSRNYTVCQGNFSERNVERS